MYTIIEKIDTININKEKIKQASNILKSGGLVAFPTETVYGLGADALNAEAAKKIYSAKGRPSDNPLIVHIAKESSLDLIAEDISEKSRKIIKRFWPGPLTMIFNKKEIVPYSTTGGLDTVAVRMPDNPIALALIEESGLCIAAPSANTSGKPSPTISGHVIDDLDGRIDMIIDGGNVGIGIESTILDMTCDPPMILRPGFITKEMLEDTIGKVDVDKTTISLKQDFKPKAPGMKYRHYAPDAELILISGKLDSVIEKINILAIENEKKGKKVGIIATEESIGQYSHGKVISLGNRNNPSSLAYNLYNVLREFNKTDVQIIYCEPFPDDNLGQAIVNRLKKASSNKIIQI
jgi:L-threonylcarbamoyladenylate synthase